MTFWIYKLGSLLSHAICFEKIKNDKQNNFKELPCKHSLALFLSLFWEDRTSLKQ